MSKCEGCGKKATRIDSEGIDLCEVCFLSCVIEAFEDKHKKILDWMNAYPLTVFPEPDMKKAARVLKENGMTLDSVSASNIRHVLGRLKKILDGEE